MATFGARLKELREAAGLTQEGLAERAKIARVTLARLETDRTIPTWPVVYDLAQALNVSCEAFPATARSMGPKPKGASKSKKPTRRRKEK